MLDQLLLYFLVAYAFTWVLHGAILVLRLPFESDLRSAGRVLYMVGILGPFVAALLASAYLSGVSGLWNLLSAALIWRFEPIWYAAAVLPIGAMYFAGVGLNIAFGGQAPKRLLQRPPHGLLLMLVGQVWVVIGEEFGWRGFALPRLHELFGWLGASLILAVLWASWHLPMFFVHGSNQYGSSFPRYVLVVTAWSIFMTMLYSRTGGSILICMIFHAAANIWAFTVNVPEDASRFELPLYLPLVIAAIALLPNPLF